MSAFKFEVGDTVWHATSAPKTGGMTEDIGGKYMVIGRFHYAETNFYWIIWTPGLGFQTCAEKDITARDPEEQERRFQEILEKHM